MRRRRKRRRTRSKQEVEDQTPCLSPESQRPRGDRKVREDQPPNHRGRANWSEDGLELVSGIGSTNDETAGGEKEMERGKLKKKYKKWKRRRRRRRRKRMRRRTRKWTRRTRRRTG